MNGRDDLGQEIAREISRTIAQKIAIGIALFFAFVLFILFGGIAVQFLWNWLVPDILALRRITFWEALGLLALCRILFGGFGRGSESHSDGRGRRSRKEWWKTPKPSATKTSAPTPIAAAPAE